MLIAHLSDPHLRAQGTLYQGLVDSNAMFDQAVATLNALTPKPDIVIVSGDLVDDGTQAEYDTVRRAFAPIDQPVFAIPGNHDDREGFRACFQKDGYIPETGPIHFAVGDDWPVRLIGFDITVPDDHYGDMTDEACDWLSAKLAEQPEKPTVLMMHQPPFDSGIPYIDAYNCRRGDRLAEILSGYRNVERVLCGHIHRFMQVRFGGTLLATAPSTTTAIALRLQDDAEPASYVEPPALLLHHWKPDTGLITHHVPIGSFPGPLPFY